MSQIHLQYNPSQCIGSRACGACLKYCPMNCIGLDTLIIMPDCIGCEQCIMNCPKGEKVLRMAHNDELGGGWISPFGYQASTNPSNPKKDDNTSENPSNPSESESSTGKKDNEQESSQKPSQEPNKEDSSKADSSFTPADRAKLEALKNAFLSAPPLQNTIKRKSHKRDRFSKAIHIYDELKSLIAY